MLAADLNGKAEQHWNKIEIYLHLRKVIPQDTDWEDCFFKIIKSLLELPQHDNSAFLS